AVALNAETVRDALAAYANRLEIAAYNGPESSVISGEPAALEELLQSFQERNVRWRKLPVRYAFHSRHMAVLQAEFQLAPPALTPQPARVPIISAVCPGAAATFGAAYWARNIREPVQFRTAIETLAGEGHFFFLDIGPHPVLNADIAQCLGALGSDGIALSSL